MIPQSSRTLRPGISVRQIFLPVLALAIPFFFYIAAVTSGKAGLEVGRIFDFLGTLAWAGLAVLFGIKSLSRKLHRFASPTFAWFLLCVAGCVWAVIHNPFLDAFESSLKQAYKVKELQAWAFPILENPGPTRALRRAEFPQWATNGVFPRPAAIVILNGDNTTSREPQIKVRWGSGVPGIWGLLLCSPTVGEGRMWVAGVYFFARPKPWGWSE